MFLLQVRSRGKSLTLAVMQLDNELMNLTLKFIKATFQLFFFGGRSHTDHNLNYESRVHSICIVMPSNHLRTAIFLYREIVSQVIAS